MVTTFYWLIADLGYKTGIQKFIPTAFVPKQKPNWKVKWNLIERSVQTGFCVKIILVEITLYEIFVILLSDAT